MRPEVFKGAMGHWIASLDHGSWDEWTPFDTWELAVDHALWLGLTNGVWGPGD